MLAKALLKRSGRPADNTSNALLKGGRLPAVQRFFRSNLLVVQTVAVFAVTLLLMASAFLVLHGLRDEENQARVFSQAALLASQVQGISRGLAPIEGGLSLESLRIIPDEPLGGIPVTRVLATRQALTDAREKAAEANRLVPGQKTIELTVAANGSVGSLDALLRSPSDDSLAGYRVSLATLEAAATSNYGQLADGARRQEASFDRGANLARWS